MRAPFFCWPRLLENGVREAGHDGTTKKVLAPKALSKHATKSTKTARKVDAMELAELLYTIYKKQL